MTNHHTGELPERERELLSLLAAGLHHREIARELGISEATVENHLHHIFGKLGVSSRVQAVLCVVHGDIVAQRNKDEGNSS